MSKARPFFPLRLEGWLPAFSVLGVSLCCVGLAWHLASDRSDQAARERFALRSELIERTIRARMLSYEALLSGGVGLFGAAGKVDRQQWRTYIDALELESRFPGILGIGFAQRVPAEALAAHERAVRAEGLQRYAVKPIGPAVERFPIVYLEPFRERNLRALGYDMFSEPVRHVAMSRARDTGLPALSGKVTLVQETERDRQAGCLLYLPVYREGVPIATVAQRQAALMGYVYAPFRMNDLMRGVMGDHFSDLDLAIFDGATQEAGARLYDSAAAREATAHEPRFSQTMPFELDQHKWTLRVTSRPEFELQASDNRHVGFLVGGLAISFLLFGITGSLASTRARAKALARSMTHALRESEERFRAVYDHAAFGIVQTTPEGTILHSNPAFAAMLGYSEEDLVGMHWSQLTHPDDQGANHQLRREMLRGERDSYQLEKRYLRSNGQIVWGSVAVTGVKREDGAFEFLLALVEDITARKQEEEAIVHQAYHDALTGLPNRLLFADRLDQALTQARRTRTPLALMFLDLDHFKAVNDGLGHASGDALLKDVAQRLRACVRSSDTVARIGGDEFTVLLPTVDGVAGAIRVARKILQSLPMTTMIDGEAVTVTPSIGICLFPDHGEEAAALMQRADDAMYASKQAGRNRFTFAEAPSASPVAH